MHVDTSRGYKSDLAFCHHNGIFDEFREQIGVGLQATV
jgi:hypothetical protein